MTSSRRLLYRRLTRYNFSMISFLENSQKLVDEAARMAQIPADVLGRLQKPDHVWEFDIALKMDDGTEKKFPAWRVQHNNALGPYKGGIRYHPASNLDEVKALASLMTWKTSLLGLPYGGAKGAIAVDPRSLSARELEELSRAYARAIVPHIGPRQDIPAPDVGTNSQIMDWMADEYAKATGQWEPAAFTGKSVEKGGSQGREVATGFGGYVVLREFLSQNDEVSLASLNLREAKLTSLPTIAIQGFGNVGAHIAQILFEKGFKIVAISDSKGALYEPDGINIPQVMEVKAKTGIIDRGTCFALTPHTGPCQTFSNEDLFTLPVDILIPAALEDQITAANADKIRARVILEMANGPTSADGEAILTRREVEVIPDILANSGGVVGSYFEWLQSLEGKYWSEAEVLAKIDDKLIEAFAAVRAKKEEYRTTWRMASYIRALERVAAALK